MAKSFRALSNIQHGEEDGDGALTQHFFPYGSVVEGLSKEIMKNLWDAGVLEEVESAPPAATKTVTKTSPNQPPASGAGGEGSSAAPGSTSSVSPSTPGDK